MSLLDRLRPDTAAPRTTVTGAASISVATRAAARAAEATGLVMAVLTGIWTAALSWVCLVLPVLLVWAASAQTTAPWAQAVRVATDGWLLLHRVGIAVPGGRVGLLPLALAALPLALCWTAGRRIGANVAHGPLAPASTRAPDVLAAVAPGLGGFALGYAAVVVGAAALARGDGVAPVLWQAVPLGVVVPLLGATPAALRALGAPVLPTLADLLRLPDRVRRTARAGALAMAVLLVAGALLVATAVVVNHDRVATLHAALAPGFVGGTVLVIAQLAMVPNLTLWCVAFLAGPGFAVGAGSLVTPGASQLGLLPLVPVLGAVPPPGPMPAALGGVLALPVLAGALAGRAVARRPVARRAGRAGGLDVVCDALTAAASAAVVLTVLIAVAGGPAGPGALATVGASPWRAGLVLAGELAAGAAVGAWLTVRRRPA